MDLVGEGASLSITRGSWMGGMFTGTVELKSDSVEHCFSDFYSKNKQIDTIFRIWISNGIVRGLMIQPLPFYSNDKLNNVVESVDNNKIYLSTCKWSKLQNKAFSYADVIEEYTL
nr:Hsp33 family molecular chaperone HslO [Clostridium argentinense]